ncbi:hypothetical protein NL108_018036 [Boleophthalmus pectinirostris]|nr:hypothetical protein NL108_018036 [Boleophthalmus pectinirostris]
MIRAATYCIFFMAQWVSSVETSRCHTALTEFSKDGYIRTCTACPSADCSPCWTSDMRAQNSAGLRPGSSLNLTMLVSTADMSTEKRSEEQSSRAEGKEENRLI